MSVSLTATDELDGKETKPAKIWPKGADRESVRPMDAVFWKCPETGNVIIGIDDPDDLDGHEVTIQLDDGAKSEYTGKFDEDGMLK